MYPSDLKIVELKIGLKSKDNKQFSYEKKETITYLYLYSYRLLMDRWQMWHARAKFDIQRGKRMNSSEIAPPQVYVRCNFCAQSLGHSLVIQNARNREGKRMNVQTSNPGGRASGKQKVKKKRITQDLPYKRVIDI